MQIQQIPILIMRKFVRLYLYVVLLLGVCQYIAARRKQDLGH